MTMNKKQMWVTIAVVIIAAAGGYFVGAAHGASASMGTKGAYAAGNGGRTRGAAGMGANGGFTTGQILSMDDKSLTIQMRNGNSQVVFYSPSVTVAKTVSGSIKDIVVGAQVMIAGTANTDGSLTAQSVQIRPADMTNGGAGKTSGTGTSNQ